MSFNCGFFRLTRVSMLLAIAITMLLLLLLSGSSLAPAPENKSIPFINNLVPTIGAAWAGDNSDDDDDDDNIPPLANGLPAEDLCVKCENRKNVLQGQGL